MLKMDQACLNLHNWVSTSENKSRELELWGQSTKCQEVILYLKFYLSVTHKNRFSLVPALEDRDDQEQ